MLARDRARRSICPGNASRPLAVRNSSPIWLNEIRSRRIREGGGFVDAADALTTDGEREIEMNITAAAVLRAIDRLPEAQRLRNALSRRSALSSGFREYRRLLGAP